MSDSNAEFVNNTIHIVSQISDNIILACGGILPILASATSPNYELDVIQSSQGLSLSTAWRLLDRLISVTHVIVFKSTISLEEIEKEKQLPTGAILRQILRLTVMCSIRNCMQSRYQPENSTDLAKCLSKMCNRSSPIQDLQRILQDRDLARLRAIIYRERFDDSNQSEFLALSAVYFLSVLLVSKYRDLLDPELEEKIQEQVNSWKFSENEENKATDKNNKEENKENVVKSENEDKVQSILKSLVENGKSKNLKSKNFGKSIIKSINSEKSENTAEKAGEKTDVATRSINELPESNTINQLTRTSSKVKNISQQLNGSMAGSVGLLSDIMVDFQEYLSSTLLGSHGQDLVKEGLGNIDLESSKNINSNKNNNNVISSVSSNQIVSIVMLLCSQEWQNSIQKNAGLAFIELINEGRVFCHNMKDNIVQVAKTAETILQRQKAEVIKQHASFQQTCAIEYDQQRQEDAQYDQLINA